MTTDDKALALADDPTAQLMQLAIQQGPDGVEALRQLVGLRREEEARAAERAFAAALTEFQAHVPPIRKVRRGAHGAAYADLDDVMATIGPTLAECGLSVSYDSEDLADGRLRVWCIVRHRDGHSERASIPVMREKSSNRMNDTQRDGSVSTYGRRYALGLALGITTGERDDDGGGGGGAVVTERQAADLRALCEEVGADVAAFLQWAETDTFAGVRADRFGKAVRMLETKRKKKRAST